MQRTQKAIREGFLSLLNEVPFDKITVIDIAARCDINRNTFYYYYGDIFSLVEDVLQTETRHIRERDITGDTWADVYKQVTAFARANQKALFNLYNSQHRARLESFLYESFLAGLEPFLSKQAADMGASQEDAHALAVFYASALTGLTVRWMRGGMTADADAYISRMSVLLGGSICRALQKSREGDAGR